VSPITVCLEVVLPRPPFELAICTRGADEAFQGTFSRSFTMSSRLVVTITIVLSRETYVFGYAFGVAALEWFGVFSFMLTLAGQWLCLAADK